MQYTQPSINQTISAEDCKTADNINFTHSMDISLSSPVKSKKFVTFNQSESQIEDITDSEIATADISVLTYMEKMEDDINDPYQRLT